MPETDLSTSLAAIERLFVGLYSATRKKTEQKRPLLVASPRELILRANGERHVADFSTPCFDVAKSIAHAVVAIFLLGQGAEEPPASVLRYESLQALLAEIGARFAAQPVLGCDALKADMHELLDACRGLMSECTAPPFPPERLARFARDCGPVVERMMGAATRDQMRALHEAVDTLFSKLTSADRAALQVIVMGDHQARTRSFLMQYFCRRLGESEGAGEHVTYGENVEREEEALELAGTRTLDATLAAAFFGDKRRMQRDLLGDAAAKCLEELPLEPEQKTSCTNVD